MVLDDLGVFLQTAGLGTLGTSLFKGGWPLDAAGGSVQDALLTLIEVPGLPPMYVHDDIAPSLDQPVVQVVTRGAPYGYAAARTRAGQAWVALGSVRNQTLGTTHYLWIRPLHAPHHALGPDEQQRPRIAFNVVCCKAVP
jgi:hypothetical protein